MLERVQGRQASRLQALLAGLGTGVVVYRLLRSGDSEDSSGTESGSEGESARESG